MRLSNFDYQLPQELIAQFPLRKRDSARLLVLNRKKRTIEHRIFKDITDYLHRDELIVLNDTRVLASRLLGARKSGGKVEVLLIQHKGNLTFRAMIKPTRVKLGEKIIFNGGETYGTINARDEITFNLKDIDAVYNLGLMPLPPYIKRKSVDLDTAYYQTVYANQDGAIASPTAGLHFTKELLNRLESFGVNLGFITLHVGLGTFQPVKADDITRHKMESEYFKVDESAIKKIDNARLNKSRIFAVGTTALRALEAYALTGVKQGDTDLFIYPGFKFNLVDCLLTNFHLPRTTLFMLVCAFAGEKLMKRAYQEAIEQKYRFYSYGDAMLIL
ncbi:MAG: tRNA preQ1(34) S-adenosylmethionine ribosyltransferase-isomerase QueA [Candidatus Omnitrophica bacterium]|nr:tRNA preQ1(34) S-adenosylmethionine ribosyltransferase-isomerase QueA [Candidatus Omnitrophota bacterium]MBU1090646.1 tRNA preQ1(34) S-adenosylmethionine ribosyltransferase-isomerase QueA [Candidatus Omnitrophota bacterium]MBU1906081.1 tRNA preQ1(34) S-adenosylmethionine ribosyltransferase-isomerase QueA [Candidatus Omnitrophota bacterium]